MSARILVIDDEDDIRALVTSRLQRLGYEVDEAATGEDGLEAATSRPPDAIVLDILLPDVNGWEVLRRLRENDATADVPVLVLSIVDDEGSNELLRPGVFLGKPFRAHQLESAVRSLF